MTEAGWLTCDDPWEMLDEVVGRASQRKLQLFACALVRRRLDDIDRSRGWGAHPGQSHLNR